MPYKSNTIFLFTCLLVLSFSSAVAQLTPQKNVTLVATKLIIPEKFKPAFPTDYTLNLPSGYKATVFYTGKLAKGRFMSWGPDSVLYIANMNSGEVLALPDKNHDLIADTVIVAAKDAYGHDVKFFQNAMYVAQEKRIEKFEDKNHDGFYEYRTIFIDSILEGKKRKPGGHTTRTLLFDEKKKKVYLSVGSSCNICREEGRAVIYEYDLNGKNQHLFASGTRNCIGLARHPKTGDLWATNNGSDYIGTDIPPEDIYRIRKNDYYGYPFAYGNGTYYDFNLHEDYKKILPITKQDSLLVRKMNKPAASLQAHMAPMAIEFTNSAFKKEYRCGAFIAMRGSFDSDPPVGYKIVFLEMNKSGKVQTVSDHVTGFNLYPQGKAWARPVGLLSDNRGNLFMSSDDLNQFILVLSPQ